MKRLHALPLASLMAMIALAVCWCFREPSPAHSQLDRRQGQRPTPLRPGETRTARLAPQGDGRYTFRIEVPDDAVFVELKLEGSPIDLSLYATYGEPAGDEHPPDVAAETEAFNERLSMTPWDQIPLEPGTYFVDVVVSAGFTPRVRGRIIKEDIEFQISYELIRAEAGEKLQTGRRADQQLGRETGFAAIMELDVPEDARQLRVDLFDAATSLDLYVGREGPVLHQDNAEVAHLGFESRKFVLVDRQSDPPLEPGKYYVCVVDPMQSAANMRFSVLASTSADPPSFLLEIPPFPEVSAGWGNALLSTVELITDGGGGTGVVIAPSGIVLTNRHVTLRADGTVPAGDEVIVAFSLNPRQPPLDLFRGRVVKADESLDLALVQITKGYYGQALKETLRFPYLSLGESERLTFGDTVFVTGYPWIGGTSGRVTLTASRGIVSGFEKLGTTEYIKTDADFHPGHSGGPVFNERFEVIGIASETVEEELSAGKVGLIRPISALPQAWRSLLTPQVDRTAR